MGVPEKGILTILLCDADGHTRIQGAGKTLKVYHTCEDLNNGCCALLIPIQEIANHLRKSISPMVGENDKLILRVIERYLL